MNAVSLPGNTKGKSGSGGLAVLEHELELGQNHVPISTSGSPVLDNLLAGQVEHLRACLKSFDKRRREADNREKQAGVGGNASISK